MQTEVETRRGNFIEMDIERRRHDRTRRLGWDHFSGARDWKLGVDTVRSRFPKDTFDNVRLSWLFEICGIN